MCESGVAVKHFPKVTEFYHGKSIFVTGAAGFIGTVLLETLLRCCPGIKSIYILLRPKKNVQPESRKEQIFNKKLFDKLKDETPEFLEKVHVVPGDISLPNLGMSEEDAQLLIEEVSIVFHCAAIINFTKPLEYTLINNVLGLDTIIRLCKQMKKFEALVYTSTAYSNCNHHKFPLKEEITRLPFHAQKFLDALKNEDKEKLQELMAHCKPDWPNSYTFSKCLAENVISDMASDLSVAIIRPSIVGSTLRHPVPGYIEGNSGLIALSLGVGKGFIKVIHADPNLKMNLVPADIVANAHVVAAWSIGTQRCASPLVVNCTATDNLQIKIKEFCSTMSEITRRFPLPKSFEQHSKLIIIRHRCLYYISVAYQHYLPAIILDAILLILGKKPRLYSLYRFLDTVIGSINYFLFHYYELERNNMDYLDRLIHSDERHNLALDFRDATLSEMSLAIPEVSPFYDWKIDRKSQKERQKITHKRHMLIACIQWTFLATCFLFIYWVLFHFITV